MPYSFPHRFPHRRLPLATVLAWLLFTSQAQALTAAEKPYVGGYTSGSVDTRSQLMLLDDNTFCFSFMGGSLDMLAGGRWKAEGGGVRLKEVRQPTVLFPVYARQMGSGPDAPPAGMASFDFHGYSISNATAPVFGMSATAELPATLRPLFPDGKNSWSDSYPLPPVAAGTARYFYLGEVERDANRQPLRVKVTQYQLGDNNQLRLGYNQDQGRPLMDLQGKLSGSTLMVDGERFGSRDELPPKTVADIRNVCVRPALVPGAKRPSEGGEEESSQPKGSRGKNDPLVPVKTFDMPLSAIKGEPWFPEKMN